MLTLVASARACDPLALLDEPLWRTLYHFHHLTEREHRAALRRRLERVDLGLMVSFGFNTPQQLNDEMRVVREAIADFDLDEQDVADKIARGLALAEKIDAGKVLSDDALVIEHSPEAIS